MKNSKIRKKLNFKLIFGFFWFLLLLVLVGWGSFKRNEKREMGLDFKIGVVADNGVALVSISNERKMVNVLNLDKEVNLWLPNLGKWEVNGLVKKDLEVDKKTELAEKMFWYNFGFWPDKILFLSSVDEWRKPQVLIKNWGLINWVKYRLSYNKMFLKQEKINGKLKENDLVLDEIMVRDFSESKLNNEDLRVSVFNNTGETGLANFMAKRLEWAGFSVVGADNNNDKMEKCLVVYGNKADLSYGGKMMSNIFDCEKRNSDNLNENEVELYFGDKLAEMIKYSSYFK